MTVIPIAFDIWTGPDSHYVFWNAISVNIVFHIYAKDAVPGPAA